MQGKTYGYARVSSRDQNLDRQMDALEEFGVDPARVFADKASGKDFERPAYAELVAALEPGDLVVVASIDRLGRNYDEILVQWRRLTRELAVDVAVLDMPLLDTRSTVDGVTGRFISDLVLQLLSYVSQIEREHIKVRQAEGIAAAQARGTRFGRPKIERPEGCAALLERVRVGTVSRRRAASELGVSRSTVERWLTEDREDEAV